MEGGQLIINHGWNGQCEERDKRRNIRGNYFGALKRLNISHNEGKSKYQIYVQDYNIGVGEAAGGGGGTGTAGRGRGAHVEPPHSVGQWG